MNQKLQKLYESMYRRAESPEKLPWHRDQPPFLLTKAAGARNPGQALDIGCGSGFYSVWLSKGGWKVTGVDFVADAVRLARDQADAANEKINFHEADVLDWNPGTTFDLILDSGCFHTLKETDHQRYMLNVSDWLEPGGDYLIVHFGRRNFFDWRPFGPTRRTKKQIEKLFGATPPGLSLIGSFSEVVKTMFPLGPRVQIVTCWFRKN